MRFATLILKIPWFAIRLLIWHPVGGILFWGGALGCNFALIRHLQNWGVGETHEIFGFLNGVGLTFLILILGYFVALARRF